MFEMPDVGQFDYSRFSVIGYGNTIVGPGGYLNFFYANRKHYSIGIGFSVELKNFSLKNFGTVVHCVDFCHQILLVNVTFIENSNGTVSISSENSEHHVTVFISNSTFVSNSVTGLGGAVNLIGTAAQEFGLTIEKSIFSGNAALTGGALYVDCRRCDIYLKENVFNFNEASVGGAAYIVNSGPTSIIGCTFESNNASFGGALDGTTTGLLLMDNIFSRNTVKSRGGAVALDVNTMHSQYDVPYSRYTSPPFITSLLGSYSDPNFDHYLILQRLFESPLTCTGNEAMRGFKGEYREGKNALSDQYPNQFAFQVNMSLYFSLVHTII